MKSVLIAKFARYRRWMPRAPYWRLAAIGIIALMTLPSAAVLVAAVFGHKTDSLTAATLVDYLTQTILYAGMTAALSLLIALPAAWLTVMRRFPGDTMVSWALFMPLALPPYLTGYAYADFMETEIGGQASGIFMAATVTALAVYPYIYLFTCGALRGQSRHIQSAARLMGYSPFAACYKISLPLARPAVAVGASLVLMETLGDIAIAEHYGVRSLGLGVYDLWLNRGDIYAACRLAALLMAAILALVLLEEQGRKKQRHYATQADRRYHSDMVVSGAGKYCYAPLLLLPAVGGFFLPVLWFIKLSVQTDVGLWRSDFWEGLGGSLSLSVLVVPILFAAALIFCMDKRQNGHGAWLLPLSKLSQAGYALPGAILAQGFFLLALWSGGNIVGGMALLLMACAVRFFIIACGAWETGLSKISPQLDAAAKLANKSMPTIIWLVHIPLLRPSLTAGVLLVFLELVKELPMTLILRPFNFNTLSTTVYQYASDESLELAAPSALTMAGIGAIAISVLFWLEKYRNN